jgi:RND family efflux transporter MFP subunit
MNKTLKIVLPVLLIAGAAGGWKTLQSRTPASAAPPSATASAPATGTLAALDLRPDDLVAVRTAPLTRTVAVSGALKAVSTAVVKARVAGELRQLGPREGETVRAGQVVGEIDPVEADLRLKQAEQQAESARAQLDITRRQLDNHRALVEQGFISTTALDTALANHRSAQSALQSALAGIDLAKKARADTLLKAPIGGQVAQRLAQPGERVAVDARVLEIVDLSRLELEAALPAADAGTLQPGAIAQLAVEGLSAPVTARVARLNPATQAGTRAVLAYLSVDAAPGLRAGLFARGTVALDSRHVPVLPVSAVRVDEPRPYVVVLDGSLLRRREVQTGLRGQIDDADMIEVTGLPDGARVLRGSLGTVRDGTPARLSAPAAVAASR